MTGPSPAADAYPAPAAVLLLHGFFGLPLMMAAMKRDAIARGLAVEAPLYPSWREPLPAIVDRLSGTLESLSQRTNGPVHIVGHSMGGLIARGLIARHRPNRLGRVVMLGTPNGGSEIADWVVTRGLAPLVLGAARTALVTRRDAAFLETLGTIDYEVGVIAGNRSSGEGPTTYLLPRPNDGKVSVAATHLAGERDHIVVPVTHRMLPFDRRAREQSWHFLDHGCFDRLPA